MKSPSDDIAEKLKANGGKLALEALKAIEDLREKNMQLGFMLLNVVSEVRPELGNEIADMLDRYNLAGAEVK